MAPEVLCKQNHGFAADYFALGVIVHELILGRRPYSGITRKDVREQVLHQQALLDTAQAGPQWSAEAVDFCNKLIQRLPERRLGLQGPQEVKAHPWLRDFPRTYFCSMSTHRIGDLDWVRHSCIG